MLKSPRSDENIFLKIYILKYGIFRIKIRDLENKRFHFNKHDDAFNMKELHKTKNLLISKSENHIIVRCIETANKIPFEKENTKTKYIYKLIINFSPFKIKYMLDNQILIVINSNNLLNMEFPSKDFIKEEQEANSSVKLDVKFKDSEYLWGLPERAGNVKLSDTEQDHEAYRLFNVDSFLYEKNQFFGLYGTIPFILSSHNQGKIYSGFIWNNPSETYVRIKSQNANKNTLWISESGIIDFSFWADSESINRFYYKYHKYIGFAELPPASALGYHQSRWNYKSTKDLRSVDRLFDEHDIPYDYIWLDIDVKI
jgi:alpha 1,3-glucosidase